MWSRAHVHGQHDDHGARKRLEPAREPGHPLNEVWRHQEDTYGDLYGFRNYGWDQIFVNGGYLNFCVRWDSPATVSATLRHQIHAKPAQQCKKTTSTTGRRPA